MIYSIGLPFPPVIENKAKKESLTSINLTWSHNNTCSLTVYTVYYKAVQLREKEQFWNRINTTTMTITLSALPLDCNTEYEFAVSAWNEFGEGFPSQSWKVKFTTGNEISCFLLQWVIEAVPRNFDREAQKTKTSTYLTTV